MVIGRYARNVAPALERAATSPSSWVIGTLAGRWSILALDALADGGCRFNALHRTLEGINHKVLMETLYKLQREGYVAGPLTTEPDDGGPWFVRYDLTPLGRQLLALIEGIREWSVEHAPELAAARSEFDQRHARETATVASAAEA